MSAGLPEALTARLAELTGAPRSVSVLPGGLTNANHKLVTDRGAYVVRRWADDSGLLAIDREHEYENSVRAAETGVGAPVVAYLPEHNAMVFGFLEGMTMHSVDLADPDRLRLAADACRRLHAARRFAGDFDMFALQRRYAAIVAERGFEQPAGYAAYAPHVAAIADALEPRREATVPCNNDLLAENFILCGQRLCIIDYEYSGNNDPCFELGNVWSEAALPPARLDELVDAYYGRHLRHKVARARLWGAMAKYGWTLWASIQQGVSELDFDFRSWGEEKYHRAVAEFESPHFDWLLDEARRPD